VECDRGFGIALYDTLLAEGWRLTACATDAPISTAPTISAAG